MSETVIQHTYRLKGGEQEAVERANPMLDRREPVVVYCNDGITRMKIGDGVHRFNDLKWLGETELTEYVQNFNTHFQFPNVGAVNVVYKAEQECLLYQWNPDTRKYEVLGPTGTEGEGYDAISGGTAADLIATYK